MNLDKKLLSPAQTANFFGVTTKTIGRWRKDGIIDAIKINGIIRFTPQEIDRVLKEKRQHYRRQRTKYF